MDGSTRRLRRALSIGLCMWIAGSAGAEEFRPEALTVKPRIDPGPNVLVYQQKWDGAGSIAVLGRDDLAMKGLLPSGAMGVMAVAPDGKTAYSQSTFMKRIVYGDAEQILQIYDVATMTVVKEITLPPKAAMVLGYNSLVQQNSEGTRLYIQNATPASSVTVVDLASAAVTAEIPTPGCWGIFPSGETRFSMPCGDGRFATFTLAADGRSAAKVSSAKIFDASSDPLFVSAAKVGEDWIFPSFNGNLYRLTFDGDVLALADKLPLAEGIDGAWRPGGYNLVAYAAKAGILFVGMHPDGKEGSHKDPIQEIWAYDLAARKLVGRAAVDHLSGFTIDESGSLMVLGLTESSKILRYIVDPAAAFAMTKTAEAKLTGFIQQVAVTP